MNPENNNQGLRSDNKSREAAESLFHKDAYLDADHIQSLLGIEVKVDSHEVKARNDRSRGSVGAGQVIEMIIVGVIVGLALVIGGMWFFEVGMFHTTMI